MKKNKKIIIVKKDWSKPNLHILQIKKTFGGGPADPPEDDYYNPTAS